MMRGAAFAEMLAGKYLQETFFPLSKEETKIQKIPPGEGTRERLVYSRKAEAIGAESLAGEEHGVSVLASLV